MKSYLDCWAQVATALLPQALAGEPQLVEGLPKPWIGDPVGFVATVGGVFEGHFSVMLDGDLLESPLMGEGADQREGWEQLLRETAEAAAGEMLASTGKACRVEKFELKTEGGPVTRAYELRSGDRVWAMLVRDRVKVASEEAPAARPVQAAAAAPSGLSPGLELLLDVELEAALRFGSRELPLGEILELGPGDVVQLDRQVSDPVDLIVADRIVARGEVVLVNGNFGLRVTEVAEPKKRLETIRCLF